MALTSLAAQLKRLETPQTSLLYHKKTKVSLLFDSKEAANFDRDTFYELGLSGLEELKKLNPQFSAFDNTLFDVTSKSFERSVETSEANEKLNHHIKTFLTLLSPYFLLKPTHKALEWLINRYHIQDFNVDDILALAFPYHETMMFARVLQLLKLSEDTGRWHWLYPVQKEGVPLSKTALLNRAGSDMSFLKFVCDMPTDAIKIHGNKASNLGTLYAFYCTTVLGGLEHANNITELHVSHLLPSVIEALGSTLPDFTASAFMILARLCTKVNLGNKLLHGLYNKIVKVNQPKLRAETTLLLALLSQNDESGQPLPDKAVKRIAKCQWFITSLSTLNQSGIVVIRLICSIISSCIKLIISGEEDLKDFVKNLIDGVLFDEEDAEQLFKCLVNSFEEGASEGTLSWYGELVRSIERKFPTVFDSVSTSVLSQKNSRSSKTLKTLLGAGTSRTVIFQQLIHPNPEIRVRAIEHISKHFDPDQVAWLRESLVERFSDENLNVVASMLQLPQPILNCLTEQSLTPYFIQITARSWQSKKHTDCLNMAITNLLISSNKEQDNLVFLTVLPVLIFCYKKVGNVILQSNLAERYLFLRALNEALDKDNPDIYHAFWVTLQNPSVVPPSKEIKKALQDLQFDHPSYKFLATLLATASICNDTDPSAIDSLINDLILYLKCPDLDVATNSKELSEDTIKESLNITRKNKWPIECALYCLKTLSIRSQEEPSTEATWIDFTSRKNSLSLAKFRIICQGCLSENNSIRKAFEIAQTSFLVDTFPQLDIQLNFLSNALLFEPSLGSYCVTLFKEILKKNMDDVRVLFSPTSAIIPSLLLLLTSADEKTRVIVLDIFKILSGVMSTSFYRAFADEISCFSEEIKMDPEQVSIAAYTLLSQNPEVKSLLSRDKHSHMKEVLDKLIYYVMHDETPVYIKSHLLEVLEFVNSKEIFLKLIPLAMNLIGKSSTLDKHNSVILFNILRRLNDNTVESISEVEVWALIEKVLADHSTEVLDSTLGKTLCPAIILMNQITRQFFDNLPEPKKKNQERILFSIIHNTAETENVHVISSTASLFKHIALDAEVVVALLSPMQTVTVVPKVLKPRMRKNLANIPSLEVLETLEWKRGVCLLEQIQSKKKLSSLHLLLPTLFEILKKCLLFEQQAPVEYTKQLVLSSVLHCCQNLTARDQLPPESLQVELIVQCVRASHNPQTHHHALLALTHMAHVVPEQVMHNIMAIFTFIGYSVLRQDDAYSFQIISKVIDTIIPVLVKSDEGKMLDLAVSNVLRVFVSAMLDIPEHRRLSLFKKLLVTLNNGSFMWIFLCLVFENHVIKHDVSHSEHISDIKQKGNNLDVGSMPKKLDISLQVCLEFSPDILIETCYKLLVHSVDLPHDKIAFEELPNLEKSKLGMVFDIERNSAKQLRHYKYTLLLFLSSILSSSRFVQQVTAMEEEETLKLEGAFRDLVEQCLIYVKNISKQADECAQLPSAKYWRVMLNQCYDILDKINALLPTEIFLGVIGSLLRQKEEPILQRKAVELLGWRLQQPSPLPSDSLLQLLPLLTEAINTITPSQTPVPQEQQLLQQTSLLTIKLMARHLATINTKEFQEVLQIVTDILCWDEPPVWAVLGSLVLCLGELISTLKAHSIFLLPKYMPSLIKIMGKLYDQDSGDLMLLSVVTSVLKVVECLAQFLSPYLSKLLYEVVLLSAKCEITTETSDSQKIQPAIQKLKAIRQKISSDVAVRVLIPSITTSFSRLIKHKKYNAVTFLMSILSESFTSSSDLTPEVTSFFLSALEFRSDSPELSNEVLKLVEPPVISSLTCLVLKLSESAFRPLYYKLFDWAVRIEEHRERAITFYCLSRTIAESLKGLFVLFAGHFVSNAASLLDKNNSEKITEPWFKTGDTDDKSCQLLESILSTLLSVFMYDAQHFITKERFNTLMQPLVDQLENRIGGEEVSKSRWDNLVTPTLAQMAASISDDTLWKQLNYQILLKTRHDSAQVRLSSLKTICALTQKLGEDFLPLLPETVPFLAELLEDEDEEVERECQRVVNEMESILGEPIQKYF